MAHLIDRYELYLRGHISVVHVVQVVMLVHVLGNGLQLHAARLVQDFNHLFLSLFSRILSHDTPPRLLQICPTAVYILFILRKTFLATSPLVENITALEMFNTIWENRGRHG